MIESGLRCGRLKLELLISKIYLEIHGFQKQNILMILQQANERLPSDKQVSLKFSNGWLHQFKARHKFKFKKSLGEYRGGSTEGTNTYRRINQP